MRKRIYQIIEVSDNEDNISQIYDVIMLIAIIVSIIPLAFKHSNTFFYYSNYITTALFIIDYILRFITADIRADKKGIIPFICYPFTFWAIIDLLSILPSIVILNQGLRLFRVFRVIRMLRVIRVFKALRYSKSISIIASVIKNSKDALIAVCALAIGYILLSALIVFNVEGQTFNTFFDAIYWATVSLTTVGYGDIYPVSTTGRIITMISSVFGIAIVALPAGIITAGYMDIINKKTEEKKETKQ